MDSHVGWFAVSRGMASGRPEQSGSVSLSDAKRVHDRRYHRFFERTEARRSGYGRVRTVICGHQVKK